MGQNNGKPNNQCGRLLAMRAGGKNFYPRCVLPNGHEGTCKSANQVKS